MKKLQNNFTTLEQSKRLFELGVPADSADCYFRIDLYSSKIEMRFTKKNSLIYDYIPCWSVGRLIEIYEIVGENAGQCVSTKKSTSRIESLVQLYEENATLLDFSKLEE